MADREMTWAELDLRAYEVLGRIGPQENPLTRYNARRAVIADLVLANEREDPIHLYPGHDPRPELIPDEVWDELSAATEVLSTSIANPARGGLGPGISAAILRLQRAQSLLYPKRPTLDEEIAADGPVIGAAFWAALEGTAEPEPDVHPLDRAIADVLEPLGGTWGIVPATWTGPRSVELHHRSGFTIEGEGETLGAAFDDAVAKALELRS